MTDGVEAGFGQLLPHPTADAGQHQPVAAALQRPSVVLDRPKERAAYFVPVPQPSDDNG